MQTQRTSINISVPLALAKRIEKVAKEENKTKSELLEEAFKSYNRAYKFRKEWAKIRLIGEQTAKRMGIKSYDDIERIAG